MVAGILSTDTLKEAGTEGVEAWEVWSTLSSVARLTEELDVEENILDGLNLTEAAAAAVGGGGMSVLAEEQCDALRRQNLSLPNTTACLGHAPQFTPESQVRAIVLGVMAVLSLVGNTATIVSIAREKRRSRSTVYTLIHHLSVADLFVTFACLTTEAVWTFTVQWFAGNFLCKFIKYMQMFSLYLSTFILVLIGVDRFTAVRYPMRRSDTQRQCSYSIIFVWVLSGVLSIPQVLVFHVVRGPFIEDFYQCVTYGLYSPAWLEKLYAVFSLVCMFVLPLLILLLTYISTFITLHKSEKVFRSERTTLGNTCPEFNRRRLLRKAKMRALRISVVIVLAFVICWTPYYMMMIIFLFTTVEDNVAAELQSAIFFFGMSNSLVNPIIYGAFHLCRCHKRRTSFNLIVINRYKMLLGHLAMWVALLHAHAAHTTHSGHTHPARGHTFTLGYLTGSERLPEDQEYKRPGLLISGAITLAVKEVNNMFPLVNEHRLNFTVAETFGREEKSILNTARLWISNISAYIGPQETCVHEARMASAFNLPMISYFCTHPETSDKTHFPTFARTRPPDTQISKSVTSVLKRFKWRKVTFFYNNSPDDNFGRVAQTIERTLPLHNITVTATKTWAATYHHGYDNNPFVSMIQETYMDSRIYVVLGHYYEFLGLMTIMEERGLFRNGEYFVVGVTLSQYDKNKPDKYLRDLLNEHTNSTVQAAFQNFLGVVPSPAPTFDIFASNVNAFLEKPPFNHPNAVHKIGGMKNIRAEAAFLYDAVHVYARALNETLKKGANPKNGRALVATILGTSYRSAMGYMVRMDEKGDAEGNYTLIGRQKHTPTPGEYGLYPVGGFRYSVGDYKGLPELHLTSPIPWKTGKPPIDEPPCGYRGLKCQSQTGEIIAGVTGGVVLLLLVVSLVAYRNWRYEQELDSLLWKIDYKDIKINDWTSNHIPAANKLSRGLYATVRSSQVSLNSNLDLDYRYASVHTQLGTYKGRVVAVKQISSKAVDITRRIKKELKTIRDLRHDNLLGFVGACVDPPNVCTVTEYCSRGSLKDILDNEDVKLDNMFIASLIGDIVQGMIYLHDSPVKSHGNLKSSNCLVDSRWVVKISDFGLHELKSGYETTSVAEAGETQRRCTDLLYRAPELLRDTSAPPGGTQKGDVYSFAIILYEVHVRHGPWGATDQSPLSVIRLVMAGVQGSNSPVRPSVEAMGSSLDCVRVVLTECWAEVPEERPDFRSVKIKLRPMRKGLKPNIFDNMLEMMEKYANNLEALVDERTDQLIQEKKKTEALLYEMLPPYVAEQLKRGRKVQAESFDCVTIYFSDIVGFTEMSAESTPLQVVDFLNDLYTCFDSIIGHYDVYKVETIGDAYMVVSGLPIRNEEQHAGEVASMSLHLLDAINKFQIRHRPTDTLKLRIGLHSGPVCAGVVGLKMPRYCLFGDTVNTASRMESSGQALKIHCSVLCRNILAKVGGYMLEERGKVKVKGKGEMTTYWLVGEDPEWKRRREKTRRQRGFHPARNGCVGGGGGGSVVALGSGAARGSLRCVRTPASPLPNTLSLESPKFLNFTLSGELATGCSCEKDALEASPPVPSSPASEDGGMMRRSTLEVKRNSYPCIKDSRDGPRRSRGHSMTGPRDDYPLLALTDLAPSPGSSFAGSGEEEALATSRRTSVSEVCPSRPPSMIEHGGDGPPPTPGEPPPSTSRPNKQHSESHDTAHLSPSALDLVLVTPPCSNVSGRPVSGGGAHTKPRYTLATGGSRWLPQSRRGSSTDGDTLSGVAAGNENGEGRTARLRYCGRQEGSSTAECEESAPLLAGVANYRIINELRAPRTQPERETPV